MKTWDWAIQYIIAIFLSLLLGAILGSISLFETTNLGDTRLTASAVVQFVGYGIALLWCWLLANRVSMELPSTPKIFFFIKHIIVPFATLIVIALAHSVVFLLVGPFLSRTGATLFNWLFILGIIASALWLTLEGFKGSTSLIGDLPSIKQSLETVFQSTPTTTDASDQASFSSSNCSKCGVAVNAGMKFCSQCGHDLTPLTCKNCGQILKAGQKFCGKCGTAVEQPPL